MNRTNKFFRKLRNIDYREAFVSARVAAAVGAQISALRQKNRWSQEDLAQRAKMKQPRIALLEKGDYESFSFATLKRLASAFGVAVRIDFLSFPAFLKWSEGFTDDVATPDSFDESVKAFQSEATKATLGAEEISSAQPSAGMSLSINPATGEAAPSLFPNSGGGQMVSSQVPMMYSDFGSLTLGGSAPFIIAGSSVGQLAGTLNLVCSAASVGIRSTGMQHHVAADEGIHQLAPYGLPPPPTLPPVQQYAKVQEREYGI
jgi:transcriptional regulator with XRE-family HTH domain